MNKKLLNTQIEALTLKHGAEIVRFYKDEGFATNSYSGILNKEDSDPARFYGADEDGNFTSRAKNSGRKTITLEEAKALISETPYPKVMLVWDNDEDYLFKRVVLMEKNGKYIAWNCAETIEESENVFDANFWNFAKDIEQPEEQPIIELTLEEIAKLKGCDVKQLRIKE